MSNVVFRKQTIHCIHVSQFIFSFFLSHCYLKSEIKICSPFYTFRSIISHLHGLLATQAVSLVSHLVISLVALSAFFTCQWHLLLLVCLLNGSCACDLLNIIQIAFVHQLHCTHTRLPECGRKEALQVFIHPTFDYISFIIAFFCLIWFNLSTHIAA